MSVNTTRATATGRTPTSGWAAWRTVNITPAERVARVTLGLAGITAAVVLLAGGGSAVVVVLEVLLLAAGLDLLVTGALGHCPLYQRLGHRPASLRASDE